VGWRDGTTVWKYLSVSNVCDSSTLLLIGSIVRKLTRARPREQQWNRGHHLSCSRYTCLRYTTCGNVLIILIGINTDWLGPMVSTSINVDSNQITQLECQSIQICLHNRSIWLSYLYVCCDNTIQFNSIQFNSICNHFHSPSQLDDWTKSSIKSPISFQTWWCPFFWLTNNNRRSKWVSQNYKLIMEYWFQSTEWADDCQF